MKNWYVVQRSDDFDFDTLFKDKERLKAFAKDGYDYIAILDKDTGSCYGVITLKGVLER